MYQYVDDVLHKTLLMIHYIFAPIETLKYLLNSKLLLLVFLFFCFVTCFSIRINVHVLKPLFVGCFVQYWINIVCLLRK